MAEAWAYGTTAEFSQMSYYLGYKDGEWVLEVPSPKVFRGTWTIRTKNYNRLACDARDFGIILPSSPPERALLRAWLKDINPADATDPPQEREVATDGP